MRSFYALGICLFLLIPSVSRAQQNQSQQQKQSAPPSTAAPAKARGPHPLVITPEEQARKNPIKFTEASVERGKGLYMTQCTMCHGKNGDGKGELATVMHLNIPDFTKPDTLAKRTDGGLAAIINKGSGTMPGEAKRLKEDQVWDLVNFLRTLQGEKPAGSPRTRPRGARK